MALDCVQALLAEGIAGGDNGSALLHSSLGTKHADILDRDSSDR